MKECKNCFIRKVNVPHVKASVGENRLFLFENDDVIGPPPPHHLRRLLISMMGNGFVLLPQKMISLKSSHPPALQLAANKSGQ